MIRKLAGCIAGIGAGFLIGTADIKAQPDVEDSFIQTVKREAEILSSLHFDILKVSDTSLSIPWNKPGVQFWIEYYKKPWNRTKLTQQVMRLKMFLPEIKRILKEEGLPEDLAILPIIESQGHPSAISRAGAAGLWQLMPSTARLFGLKVNRYIDERFDVEKSTKVAAKYLKYLYAKFGRWDIAIAAYNAGPANIEKLMATNKADAFWGMAKVPYETLNYVPKFYAVLSIVRSNELFKTDQKVHRIIKVKALSRTRLYSIAKKLHISYRILKLYNKQFKKGIVPRNHYVYIPSKFLRERSVMKELVKSRVYIYRARKTERISKIASRFGVSEETVKRINKLKRSVVYRGQIILIVALDSIPGRKIIEETAV